MTVRILALLMLQFVGQQIWAQALPSSSLTIDAYIHQGWDSLSRSMSECKSLVDPKVTAPPVLYLPFGAPTPPELLRLRSQCKIQIAHLPHRIEHLGDVKESEIPQPGLLYLPNRYVVPGGRFNEMFGWDSYFIILGLLRDGRVDLARGMVENFFYEIENYGAVLNANRTYFLTRSQPPFLSSMIRAVYDAACARDRSPANLARQRQWLARAYPYARRDHDFWLSNIHRAGDTGLARYFDIGEGPVPDIADHSSYYIDVINWLVAHPEVHTNYLITAPQHPSPAEQAVLAKTSCDATHSVGLRPRLGPWLSSYPRLLQGRSLRARVWFRHFVPVWSVQRFHTPLRCRRPEQLALPLRNGPGQLCRHGRPGGASISTG